MTVSCLAVFLLISTPSDATSCVVFLSDGKLYIGADGLRTNLDNGTHTFQCKITNYNGTVALSWGHAETIVSENGKTTREFYSTQVNSVLASNGSVVEKRDVLLAKAKAFLIRTMDSIDRTQRTITSEFVAQVNLGTVFFTFEEGVPRFDAFVLGITDWPKRLLSQRLFSDREADWKRAMGFGIIQAVKETNAKMNANGDAVIRAHADPAAFIKNILERQHEITPKYTGPPYAIAVLDGSQFRLIEKGACNQ
jgi:hypothetical protein